MMSLDTDTKQLVLSIFEGIQEIKGKDVIGLDLTDRESYTDFLFLASGGSDRQVGAIADNILKKAFEKTRRHPLGVEGLEQCDWVLIDFGEVVAHVFNEEVRDDYHLEDMWLNVQPIPEDKLETFVKNH